MARTAIIRILIFLVVALVVRAGIGVAWLVFVEQAPLNFMLDVYAPFAVTGSLAAVLTTYSVKPVPVRWLVAWFAAIAVSAAHFWLGLRVAAVQAGSEAWLLHLSSWAVAFALAGYADAKLRISPK